MPTTWALACEVSYVGNDPALCQAVEELRWRSSIFDRLRGAMRIAPVDGDNGLNDEGTAGAMTSIRKSVEIFRKELDTDPKLAADSLCIGMAGQIDKYWDKLFTDPIIMDTPKGAITICPQRTNNILERFFRDERHSYRRKTGNDSMGRTPRAMLADTPLVKNLDNPSYMKILLDGKANLEEPFAELGEAHLAPDNELQADTDRMPPGFRALMKLQALPDHVVHSLRQSVKVAVSN